MKLALRQEEGLSVLEVSGGVDAHNFQILKAGISKLLREGKNRIILHFTEADQLSGEVIRELAIIDVFARELSGKIVLSSPNKLLKESVRSFAKPPVIPILSTVELALEYFRRLITEEEEGGEGNAELRKTIEEKDKQISALEARVKQLDPKEIQKARSEKAELQQKVTLLESQVEELLKRQRDPADAEGFLEKINFLEDSIKKLSEAGAKKA